MKKPVSATAALVLLLCIALTPGTLFAAGKKASPAEKKKAMIKRGEYLVMVGGCNDCHTPKKMTPNGPVPDEARLLAGHQADETLPPLPTGLIGPGKWGALTNNNLTAWVGPWGTSYAANLSPDPETGTGAWDEKLFITILRTGKFMGAGRPILPPMPWYDLGRMKTGDLKAMFAYLQSLKPVRNLVPPPDPPESQMPKP